jgi:hypothetical protein
MIIGKDTKNALTYPPPPLTFISIDFASSSASKAGSKTGDLQN